MPLSVSLGVVTDSVCELSHGEGCCAVFQGETSLLVSQREVSWNWEWTGFQRASRETLASGECRSLDKCRLTYETEVRE